MELNEIVFNTAMCFPRFDSSQQFNLKLKKVAKWGCFTQIAWFSLDIGG
jgi:hypothetical protein